MKKPNLLLEIISFGIGIFSVGLLFNYIAGYTWEQNIADNFSMRRIIINLVIMCVYGYFKYRKQTKV